MSESTPVLLLAFNRPGLTAQVFERIRSIKPARLYVHVDGPRADKPGEDMLVMQVRKLVEEGLDWDVQLTTWFRDANAGLQKGVSEAITWFFEHEPWGVILEDDCLPDPAFFPFAGELLRRYADDEQIMHIGGSNLLQDHFQHHPHSFVFSRFSFIWGWASWRRAWKKYSADFPGLEAYATSPAFARFMPDAMARTYFLDKFRATQRKLNHTWDYAWFYTIIQNEGLCIVPKVNLVQNIGIGDAQATHTHKPDMRQALGTQPIQFPLSIPTQREVDPGLEKLFFYNSQKQRHRLWLWYFLYRLGLRGVR